LWKYIPEALGMPWTRSPCPRRGGMIDRAPWRRKRDKKDWRSYAKNDIKGKDESHRPEILDRSVVEFKEQKPLALQRAHAGRECSRMKAIKKAMEAHRAFFRSGRTLDVDFRLEALAKLRDALVGYEDRINRAFWEDLHKSEFEVFGTEIGMILREIKHHSAKVKKWAKPNRVSTDLLNFYSTSRIRSEPYGVVLIMSPWNYPLQLALLPLVGAISAGNCVMVKPAHYSSNVSGIIREIITKTFPSEYISVFTGDRTVNQAVLEERFDLIFFTGSPYLGRIVMEKAARHLTPVVLELGGKSPCIVEADAKLDAAAQRITFGKFLNAGQTCIAPDHLFAHEEIKDRLLSKIRETIIRFYGDDPEQSPDYGRIINSRQFERLESLMKSGGRIVHGGEVNASSRYIAPTMIDDITYDDPIMQEEIFGPLLPVMVYSDLDDVIDAINDHEKPLALYVFGSSEEKIEKVLARTSSGGGCVNDTIMHVVSSTMPFGGVGNSGMGSYHGKYSFDAFSHHRSILHKSTLFNPTIAYPPYRNKPKFIRKLLS